MTTHLHHSSTWATRLAAFRRGHPGLAYGLAAAAVAAGALARVSLDALWGRELRFFTFYPAVIAAAYVGGLAPGLLASALSTAAAALLWLRHLPTWSSAPLGDYVGLAVFLGLGAVISILMESLHRATDAHARLEVEAARSAERLRLVHEVDQAIIATETPEAIAEAVIRPLQALLGVPRVVVSLFDLAAGEAEWLAAVGRRRVRVGPGVRYSIHLMGDVEALRRGAIQVVDVRSLPPGPEADALRASGVEEFVVVPMTAGGELIGGLGFGEGKRVFSPEQISIAQEMAAQLAISIAHARLHERVKRQTKELERRVQERTAELKATQDTLVQAERLAILGRLAGGISHELRNPLGVISNAAYYLNIVAPDDARMRKHVAIVQREAARATRIVSGLLDFSRVAPPRAVAVDLNAAVRELLDELSVPPVVRIALELGSDVPATVADPDHVRIIASNIVTNALQAMPDGGVLTIATGRRGSLVWLAVADTGPGIDPAHVDRIFDPLFTTKATGIGLGLAIVKTLAERNAVRIAVESAPGKGTRFTLTFGFPGAEPEPTAPAA